MLRVISFTWWIHVYRIFIFIFAEFGTQEVRFVRIFQFEFVVSAESSPTAPSPVFTLPSPWSPTLLVVYGHLFPSAVIDKWFPFVLGRMSRLAWKEKIFPGRRGRNQQIGEWLLVCSLQSLWLNFSSLMQMFSLQPESEKLCVSTNTATRMRTTSAIRSFTLNYWWSAVLLLNQKISAHGMFSLTLISPLDYISPPQCSSWKLTVIFPLWKLFPRQAFERTASETSQDPFTFV